MPNVRKPIPKTQKQLGNEQVVPFSPEAGNPNNFNPSPTENRALQTSFKEDTVKVTISLSKSSVDFFKKEAKKHDTKYQIHLIAIYTN